MICDEWDVAVMIMTMVFPITMAHMAILVISCYFQCPKP